MKIGNIVLVSAVTGMLWFTSAQAAETPAATPGRGQAAMAERQKAMFEKLGLDEATKTKLTAVLAEQGKKMQELRAKTDLSQEDRRAEMGKIREATLKKIQDDKILTTEQFAKYKELSAQRPGGRRPAAN